MNCPNVQYTFIESEKVNWKNYVSFSLSTLLVHSVSRLCDSFRLFITCGLWFIRFFSVWAFCSFCHIKPKPYIFLFNAAYEIIWIIPISHSRRKQNEQNIARMILSDFTLVPFSVDKCMCEHVCVYECGSGRYFIHGNLTWKDKLRSIFTLNEVMLLSNSEFLVGCGSCVQYTRNPHEWANSKSYQLTTVNYRENLSTFSMSFFVVCVCFC